jgi:hypothetical protein
MVRKDHRVQMDYKVRQGQSGRKVLQEQRGLKDLLVRRDQPEQRVIPGLMVQLGRKVLLGPEVV